MEAERLVRLLDDLDAAGAAYWLDGGWGVDALLGEQTRAHGDVDLVLHRADLAGVRELLVAQGYAVLRDWLPATLALRHPDGREVDLHPVDPTPDGGGDQDLVAPGIAPGGPDSWRYGPPVAGSVAGRAVRCAGAEEQVAMHQGYDVRDVDRHDLGLLSARLGVRLPAGFGPDGIERTASVAAVVRRVLAAGGGGGPVGVAGRASPWREDLATVLRERLPGHDVVVGGPELRSERDDVGVLVWVEDGARDEPPDGWRSAAPPLGSWDDDRLACPGGTDVAFVPVSGVLPPRRLRLLHDHADGVVWDEGGGRLGENADLLPISHALRRAIAAYHEACVAAGHGYHRHEPERRRLAQRLARELAPEFVVEVTQ